MSALKDEIRDGDALKFKHAIAQAARDKRIKVLEDMVQEYQNTLHETKTTYSQELEGRTPVSAANCVTRSTR